MSNQDREKRQEFEAAMRALPCPIHWTFESDGCDGYHMTATDWAFIGWQAALSTTGPRKSNVDKLINARAMLQEVCNAYHQDGIEVGLQRRAAEPAGFDTWQANPYTKVLQKSIAENYVPRAAGLVIPEPPTADALDAKRYRFLRDQYEGRSYTTDSGPRPSTPESRVAYAIKNFGERTLDMIEIHLLCHHLGPREEPFWTPGDHFDYGRNMDAALDAAMLLAAPTLGDQG